MAKPEINLVWFKRDLRLRDHAPLKAAINAGLPVLLAFWAEPSVRALPEYSDRHWNFMFQSLTEIDANLAPFGACVHWFSGEVVPTFEALREHFHIRTVFSHQETGQALTFQRDIDFGKYCRKNGIEWQEFQCNGVIRGLKNRDSWADSWVEFMNSPQETPELAKLKTVQLPGSISHVLDGQLQPITEKTALFQRDRIFQPGGEKPAWEYLNTFLRDRGRNYNRHISKPEFSRKSCSRTSPYLAWGNLSMRQVWQAYGETYPHSGFKRPLSAFRSRLFWHCHFIQKFEMEVRYETENLNRGYDLIRKERDEKLIAAWQTGQTGIPLVDACMRCVNETGYLNFRMRAMLVSVLTHHFFQPWQAGTAHLAAQFLDYEPGIHFPQFQMQAGTTGANTFRIYNPLKQAEDHDPEAEFIKKWVPELAELPPKLALAPWEIGPLEESFHQFKPGKDYPRPVVNVAEAARHARDELYRVAKTDLANREKSRILKKHVNSKTRRKTAKI